MENLNPPEITEKIKLLGSSINKDFDYNEWLNKFNKLLILIITKNENAKKFDLLLLLEEGFRNYQSIIAENKNFKKVFKILLLKSINIFDNDELIIITKILNGLINCSIKGNSIYQISFELINVENKDELNENYIDLNYLSFLFKYFLFFYFNINFNVHHKQIYFKEIIYSRIENIFQLNLNNIKNIFVKHFSKLFQKIGIFIYTIPKTVNNLFVDILSKLGKNELFQRLLKEICNEKLKNENSDFNIIYNSLFIEEQIKYYNNFIKQENENDIDIKSLFKLFLKNDIKFDIHLVNNKKKFTDFLSNEVMNNFENFELFPQDFFISSNDTNNVFSDFSFYNIEYREFYLLKNCYEDELPQYSNNNYIINKFLNSPYQIVQTFICGNKNVGEQINDNLNFEEYFLILLLLYQVYKSNQDKNEEIKSLINLYFNKTFEQTCKEQELYVSFFNFILLIDKELNDVCLYSLEANRKFFELSKINNNKYMKIIFSYFIFSINYINKLEISQDIFLKEIDLIVKYIKIMNKFCENYNLSKLQYLNIQLICILIKIFLIDNDYQNNNFIEQFFEYCLFCYKKIDYQYHNFKIKKISDYLFECPNCKKYNIFLKINKPYINSLNKEKKQNILQILLNGNIDNFETILTKNLGEYRNSKDERYIFLKLIEIEIKSIFKLIKKFDINIYYIKEETYPNYFNFIKNPLSFDEKYINPIFDISYKLYLNLLKDPEKSKEYIDKIKLLFWIVYSKRKY